MLHDDSLHLRGLEVLRPQRVEKAGSEVEAFLLYAYVVGESLMSTQGGPSQKEERSRFVERLIQQPLAEPVESR